MGTYIEAFVEEDKRKRAEIANKVKDWLKNELAETEKHLKESETSLLDFTKKNGNRIPQQEPESSGQRV